MSTTYKPKPINTNGIKLGPELEGLLEALAKNTHEVWACQRIADGWQYGPKRDDAKRHHPCLVPYDQLPESEKEYDRGTALEVIKVIHCLGFSIINGLS